MRRKVKNRNIVKPDRKYNSADISKFINYIMWGGGKSTATAIVYEALEKAEKDLGQPGLDIFKRVLDNVSPLMEVRAKRVGGANYQVPMEVRPERKLQLALRWIIEAARGKKGKPMAMKLAEELILGYKNDGTAVKKKEEMHRMADANKAFAHFANR
jgi:small subunit ribosomal protein S7